jgi:hypothetical protein
MGRINIKPEGFKGLSQFSMATKIAKISLEGIEPRSLNGFKLAIEKFDSVQMDKIKYKETRLAYNEPDNSLYLLTEFIGKIETDEVLRDFVLLNWPKEEIFVTKNFKDTDCFVQISDLNDDVQSVLQPVIPPKDQHFLGVVFDSPEKQLMYEEFLTDPIIFNRLKSMCKTAKLDITDDMTSSAMLPIHKKDKFTNEILISSRVLNVFNQFQFAQNYIRGFEVGTAEHDLGKMLILDPYFCDYMMMRAERAYNLSKKEQTEEQIKDELERSNKLYQIELERSVKKINKDPYLLSLYENNLVINE